MKALTLWQPWAWAMANGIKLVENRLWPPPAGLTGQWFALHASKHWDRDSARQLAGTLHNYEPSAPLCAAEVELGAVVAVTRLVRVVTDAADLAPDQRRFFFGPFGWVVTDTRTLRVPVPCRGFQRLWGLRRDIEQDVRRQTIGDPPQLSFPDGLCVVCGRPATEDDRCGYHTGHFQPADLGERMRESWRRRREEGQ